jgi:hypothetical protein
MPDVANGEVNSPKTPSLLQDIKTALSKLLKWAIGIGVVVFVAWWLLPNNWQIKYATEYWVDADKVVVEHKPYDCDWDSAPIGSKHCHYEPVVTVYNQYGNIMEGPGLVKENPPNDQNPAKVHVDWVRVED